MPTHPTFFKDQPMTCLKNTLLATSWLLLASLSFAQAPDYFFKDGDVVVMIGDSITEQHLYSNYVEMWTLTRFPNWKLTFRNVGIGGDTSVGGKTRFARDVLIHKPTAMTVDFGMNDGRYKAFEESTYRPYMNGLQGMADQAIAAKIRVAWVTPQPLDSDDQGPTALVGYNQTLEKFSDGVKQIAEKNGGKFVDQFHPYLTTLDTARSKGPKYDRITAGDAVHPGPPGQALMAASILKGLNFPSLVASVEIDASNGRVVDAKNTSIEDIAKKDGGVSFSRTDAALPFFPEEASTILTHNPILTDLNNYFIKVTGLSAGKYDVLVGGMKVTELTADELAAGVNIAAAVLKEGPIADQVKSVKAAVQKKNGFHHDEIFRGIVLAGNVPNWVYSVISKDELEAKRKAILDERYAKLAELDAEVVSTLKMKSIPFEVKPAK
jgi:lysophospholipase L1-like esterase